LLSPYELVDSEKAAFPVAVLCKTIGVSRSAYYDGSACTRVASSAGRCSVA